METKDYSFPVSGPVDSSVTNISGAVTIHLEPTDTATVRVTAPTLDDLETVGVHLDGGRLVVDITVRSSDLASLWRRFVGPRVDVALVLPTWSAVRVRTGQGDVSVHGDAGDASLTSGSGRITVDSCASLSGTTGSGGIEVGTVRGQVGVRSGSGSITVHEAGGDVDALTGSGGIVIGSAAGNVGATSGSGTLTMREGPGREGSLKSGSGNIRVDRMGPGSLTANTASGTITVAVLPGVPVWADLHSVSGRVRRQLEPVGAPQDGQPYASVRARAISGDVLVRQA